MLNLRGKIKSEIVRNIGSDNDNKKYYHLKATQCFVPSGFVTMCAVEMARILTVSSAKGIV